MLIKSHNKNGNDQFFLHAWPIKPPQYPSALDQKCVKKNLSSVFSPNATGACRTLFINPRF